MTSLAVAALALVQKFWVEVMVISVAGALYLFGFKIKEKVLNFIKKAKQEDPILASAKNDLRVNDLLVELRTKYNADRAYVFQFHNGVHYNNKNSMLKMSCTHEKVSAGTSEEHDRLQDILVSKHPETIISLITNGVYAIPDVNKMDASAYKASLMERGIQGIVLCVFGKSKKEIEGFIALDYREPDQIPSKYEVLMAEATVVGNALRNNG